MGRKKGRNIFKQGSQRQLRERAEAGSHGQGQDRVTAAARDNREDTAQQRDRVTVPNTQHNHSLAPQSSAAMEMECDVCQETFNTSNRKPRNLQCGHSFCTECCQRMIKMCQIQCPQCRQKTKTASDASELPVNYALLHLLDDLDSHKSPEGNKVSPQNKKSLHDGKCLDSGAKVVAHCVKCQQWLCEECSASDHSSRGCKLVPWEHALSEMMQACGCRGKSACGRIKDYCSTVEGYRDQLAAFEATLEVTLGCVKRKQNELEKILDEGKERTSELEAMLSTTTTSEPSQGLAFVAAMKDATKKARAFTTIPVVLLDDKMSALSKMLLQVVVPLHIHPVEGGSPRVVVGLHTLNTTTLSSRVETDGNRLIVHSLKQEAPPADSMAMQFQFIKSCINIAGALTFLDITVRGSPPGRVFIRLLGNTQRALHFLLMCTGELGPSFLNACCHRVWWRGKPGESVWMGDHEQSDGSGGALPEEILAQGQDLPNVSIKLPVTAGIVAGTYGKRSTSSIFRVYTRDMTEAIDEAAFAKVEYGLGVIQNALQQTITDAVITGCGVVVES